MVSHAMQVQRPQGASFIHSAIASHLRELGYPEKSILSMNRCGEESGFYAFKECLCGVKQISLTHRCNLRTCLHCSKYRKRRTFSGLLPYFKLYRVTKRDILQFLTISPKNYKTLEEGLKHVRESFRKFLRRKYVKERVRGGFYVIEAKEKDDLTWNVHLHIIVYGSWLDYRLRGRCMECNQNLLKFDKESKKFYCANRKCNSMNVIKNDNTTLGREWLACSGSNAHIYGERVRAVHGAVHYLTKYISMNKDSFQSLGGFANFVYQTHNKQLINPFGEFLKDRRKNGKFYENWKNIKKFVCFCPICESKIEFTFDIQVSYMIRESMQRKAMPPDLFSEGNALGALSVSPNVK